MKGCAPKNACFKPKHSKIGICDLLQKSFVETFVGEVKSYNLEERVDSDGNVGYLILVGGRFGAEKGKHRKDLGNCMVF